MFEITEGMFLLSLLLLLLVLLDSKFSFGTTERLLTLSGQLKELISARLWFMTKFMINGLPGTSSGTILMMDA